jgi:ubiquinone/menaquinone biosynthesis C-methylase UbiE
MQTIVRRYLSTLAVPDGARALELGCGNGASTRAFLQHLPVGELVGIDPSPAFVEMATEALGGDSGARFQTGDAGDTGQPDESFDLALAHTVLSDVPEPERALAEAFRVLRPGGQSVVFDGDYAMANLSATGITGRFGPFKAQRFGDPEAFCPPEATGSANCEPGITSCR